MSTQELIETNQDRTSPVEKLRDRVNSFAVIDKHGEVLGKVRDIVLNENRHLNFVVSQVNEQSSRLFLLISHLIERIDYPHQSIFAKVSQAEVEDFPEYINIETLSDSTSPAIPDNTVVEGIANRDDAVDTLDVSANVADLAGLPNFDKMEVLSEEVIRLLGERVVVERSKRRVGEVVFRKEIETLMVEIPVRREKLIVEQVSPERKQLAQIDLGQEAPIDFELNKTPQFSAITQDTHLTAQGEFVSPRDCSLFLNAISMTNPHNCKKVKVEIVVEDAELQQTYQQWFDRCSD